MDGGRWRKGRRTAAAKESAAETSPADVVAPEDQCQDELSSIKEQMGTLYGVIESLQGRSDPVAVQWLESSKRQLRDLRIQATRTKPLAVQVQTLTDLVEKRETQVAIASATLLKAQEHLERMTAEFETAQAELAHVKDMHAQETRKPSGTVGVTGGHVMILEEMAKGLPEDQAQVVRQGLRLLLPVLTAAGMTPIPSPAGSVSPRAGMAVDGDNLSDTSLPVQEDGYGDASSRPGSVAATTRTAVHVDQATPCTQRLPRVRGRSANRSKVTAPAQPMEASTTSVRRSRSPVRAGVRSRLRTKSCMPLGFPVDPRLATGIPEVFQTARDPLRRG